MSKSANPGEMRTLIEIKSFTESTNENGITKKHWENVFGEGVFVGCKWVNVHGTEALTAAALNLKEPATLTMRYSAKITPACRVFLRGDPAPYEMMSLDNVENRGRWLEIKVQRTVAAK